MSQCFTKMCTDPRNVESDYSNDVQGICNDGAHGRRMTHAPDEKWTVWMSSFMSITMLLSRAR